MAKYVNAAEAAEKVAAATGISLADLIGEKNPFWRVLSWADFLKPDVPDDIKPKLRRYFGEKVKWEGGKWQIDT